MKGVYNLNRFITLCEEIKNIVTQMEAQAKQTLSTNCGKLELLAEQLLKHEALAKEEVEDILEAAEQRAN